MNSPKKVTSNDSKTPRDSAGAAPVPWPFPDTLIRPEPYQPLSPTFADMMTDLGDAKW